MCVFVVIFIFVCAISSQPIDTDKGAAEWEKSGYFEGDILIEKPKSNRLVTDERRGRNGLRNIDRRWPHKTVIYAFNDTITSDEKQNIVAALDELAQMSCILFREKTDDDVDYIFINNDGGCFSNVGHIGGKQNLGLAYPGCHRKKTIQHEFLHSLGFRHMQSDPSRDQYVLVLTENIREGFAHNFQSYQNLDRFGVEYDLDSVMHYTSRAFSKNGLPTIIARHDPNYPIGEVDNLSAGDYHKLNLMYECTDKL